MQELRLPAVGEHEGGEAEQVAVGWKAGDIYT